MAGRLSFDNYAAREFHSTQRRQAGIPATVRPVLPGALKFHSSSFLDRVRVDNPLEAHNWPSSSSTSSISPVATSSRIIRITSAWARSPSLRRTEAICRSSSRS